MQLGPQESKHPNRDPALAWLAHLDMIKFFIASGLDTAMIMEDDVAWDLAIKDQMPLISDAVRSFSQVDSSDLTPYGYSWDVLWLGNCGEMTEGDTLRHEYNDTTLGRPAPWELYAGWSKFKLKNVKEGHRVIQMANLPVCSFAYALNRKSAQKVLTWAGRGADEAFDVVLSVGCREGHLKCITINPEIMHHYNPADARYLSQAKAGDRKSSELKEAVFEHVKGNTANMVRSARCEALFHETCLQPPT